MYHHLCPRCGLAFPEWQPVHLICLLLRLRYILAPFFIISALMSVSLWLYLRSAVQTDNNYTEQTQTSSTEKSIPPILTRQNDNAPSANSSAVTQVPVIKPTPVTPSSPVTQPSQSLTNVKLANLLPKHHYEDRFPGEIDERLSEGWYLIKPAILYKVPFDYTLEKDKAVIIKELDAGVRLTTNAYRTFTSQYGICEITRPRTVKLDYAQSLGGIVSITLQLNPGDKLFSLMAYGEDTCKIWFKGKEYETNCPCPGCDQNHPLPCDNETQQLQLNWWAKVNLPDGTSGWLHEPERSIEPPKKTVQQPIIPTPALSDTKPIPAQSDLGETVYYVNTQQLNVRSGPGSEYDILTKLPRGESIIALTRVESQDKGFWMKIRTGYLEGWVNEKLVSRDKSDAINKQPFTPMVDEIVYYVNTKNLNVRSGPGPEYSVITKLSQGSPVRSLEKTESKDGGFWMKIRTGSLEGWVNEKLLSRNKYEASISDQKLASTSSVTNPKIIKHPNGIPSNFIKYFDEYNTKSDNKAIALAIDRYRKWAWVAGYGYSFSTQSQANERAMSECMKRLSQSIIQGSCRLYATGTNIIW